MQGGMKALTAMKMYIHHNVLGSTWGLTAGWRPGLSQWSYPHIYFHTCQGITEKMLSKLPPLGVQDLQMQRVRRLLEARAKATAVEIAAAERAERAERGRILLDQVMNPQEFTYCLLGPHSQCMCS